MMAATAEIWQSDTLSVLPVVLLEGRAA